MRIAHVTDGMTSSVNADLELSRRLRNAGHEVVFLSPADVGSKIEADGLEFVPLVGDRPFVEGSPPVGWSSLRQPANFARRVAERRRLRIESIANDEIEQAVRSLAPDVLLLDFEMHFARLATASLGIPTALTSVFFSVFRRPGLPPLGSTTRPDRTGQESLDREWQRSRAATAGLELRQRAIRSARADWFRPARYQSMDIDTLRQVAASRGFVLDTMVDRSHWQRPFVHRGVPFLSFNLAELELDHDHHPDIHYVGPMVSVDRTETAVGPQDRQAWEAFRTNRDTSRPLVYCSLGSYWKADVSILERILAAFARRDDWDLVLGLGGTIDRSQLGPVPSNVLLLDYAPQTEVLAESRCAIVHGGATTLAECVVLGVPMVVHSTGHVDQNGNATRIDVRRLGIVGNPSDSVTEIETAVARVLSDEGFGRRVRAMQTLATERQHEAVRLLETLAGQTTTP